MSNNDRGWMYKRIEGRLISKEWITRLETQFLNTSFSNEAIVKRKSVGGTFKQAIRCPCSNCKCKKYKCRDDVHLDLMKFGFQPDYTTWWAHGEAFSYAQEIGECSNSTRDDDNDFDGCTRMVLDNMHPVDFNNWEEQVPNSSAKGFYDMLQAADTPLYPGCQTFSTLEWAARLLNWKSECNVPVSTYDRLVRDLNEAFPMGSNVDKNFYETKRRLSKLSLPVEKIDACKNHCMLYYKEKKGLVNCEVCGSSRYKINGRSKNLKNNELMEEDYFVNGYKFHTKQYGVGRVTTNSGVCVKGSVYDDSECDYYGSLVEVLEVEYHGGKDDRCIVVLFKCDWFHPQEGVRIISKHSMVDVKSNKKGCLDDPFILASQAQQVYYATYPSMKKDLKDWWAVVKTKPRSVYEVTEAASEVCDDDNLDEEPFFQENERITCAPSISTHEHVCLVSGGALEEIAQVSNNDGFVDTMEASDDDLILSDSDEDENSDDDLVFPDSDEDENCDDDLVLSDHSSHEE